MIYFGFVLLDEAIKERKQENKNKKNWTILQTTGIKCQLYNLSV